MDQDPARCRFCGEVAQVLAHEASVLDQFNLPDSHTKFPPVCPDCNTSVRFLIRVLFLLRGWNPVFIDYSLPAQRWVTAERLEDLHMLRRGDIALTRAS